MQKSISAKKRSAKPTRRVAATVAAVATVAFATSAVGPGVSPAQASIIECPPSGTCPTNHNEVLATTAGG